MIETLVLLVSAVVFFSGSSIQKEKTMFTNIKEKENASVKVEMEDNSFWVSDTTPTVRVMYWCDETCDGWEKYVEKSRKSIGGASSFGN